MKSRNRKSKKIATSRYMAVFAGLGLGYGLIGEAFLYKLLTEKLYTPLGIALYFLLFGVIVGVVNLIFAFFKVDQSSRGNAKNRKEIYVVLSIILAVLFVFSGLIEFLYELGKQSVPEPTSYIFLIDDSASMGGTEQLRTNAIKDIMENNQEHLPYAVYKFTTSVEQLKAMGKYQEKDAEAITFLSDGNTDVLGSINTILDDFMNGRLAGAGVYPRIILLSDGVSSSSGMKSITKECVNNGLSISSVGIGGCNANYLQRIANLTGGSYVYCTDAAHLAESIREVISDNLSRNLLSARFVFETDGLYCFLRILFLLMLSAIWTFIKIQSAQNPSEIDKKNWLLSMFACFVGTLGIEFLSRTTISIGFLRITFCVLWALMIGNLPDKIQNTRPNLNIDDNANGDTSKNTDFFDRLNEENGSKKDLTRTIGFDTGLQSEENLPFDDNQNGQDDIFNVNAFDNTGNGAAFDSSDGFSGFGNSGAFDSPETFGNSSVFDDSENTGNF